METVLTHFEDLGCRQGLDFIFECFYNEDQNNTEKNLIIDSNSLTVEKFLTDQNSSHNNPNDKAKKVYSQLSDHFGLSCEISYKGNIVS